VELEFHPPLVVAPATSSDSDSEFVCLAHARLWVRVELAAWQVVRQGHIHLVRPASARGGWRTVDLSGHPVRLWTGRTETVSLDDVGQELADWLAQRPLSFYRIPELAAVSEMGETIEDFRRRVLGGVGEEVRRRLDAIDQAPRSRLPWRRRPENSERALRRRRLATGVARLGAGIEELDVGDESWIAARAEAGVLLVDPEISLPPRSRRDLMLDRAVTQNDVNRER